MYRPNEYMLIDGDLHKVEVGQLVLKEDYERLVKKYKRLVRFGHRTGIFTALKENQNLIRDKVNEERENTDRRKVRRYKTRSNTR